MFCYTCRFQTWSACIISIYISYVTSRFQIPWLLPDPQHICTALSFGMNFVQSIRAQKSRLATVSEHKQKVLPTVLSNSLDSAFQATNLAQLRAEQLETWSRARRRISHRRFALNIKRMLEDDACHKLTSLPKELLVKPAKEGKEQPSHLLKPKIRASIFASLNDGS